MARAADITVTTTSDALDADDGTSEFSEAFTAETPVLRPNSSKSADRETVSPGAVMTYTFTLSNRRNHLQLGHSERWSWLCL